MTEEKKQELRQILTQAIDESEIRNGNGESLVMPKDVYRRFVQERWKYFGLDPLSPLWIILTLEIKSGAIRSRLRDFINHELALHVAGDTISTAIYFIESYSADGPSVYHFRSQNIPVDFILRRLLDITIVRGVEEAVFVFDRCSGPEGSHGLFQEVSVIEGISLKEDIELFRGVRLVPLLESGISEQVLCCFPRVLRFLIKREFPNFFGHTLLIIDRPGISIFHKPGPHQEFPQGLPVQHLPFQVEKHDLRFRNCHEVDAFKEIFCQALSLVLHDPIQIPRGSYFFEEDRTVNLRDVTLPYLIRANQTRRFTRPDEYHIENAKCLYHVLESKPELREKLRIPIDRWIKSKSSGNVDDKFIDLGIALEALYVSERGTRGKGKQIRQNASEYLTTDAARKDKLEKIFKAIYDYRSDVVHNNDPGEKVSIGEKCIHISDLVVCAQNLCVESINKIIEEGTFPDRSALGKTAHRNK